MPLKLFPLIFQQIEPFAKFGEKNVKVTVLFAYAGFWKTDPLR